MTSIFKPMHGTMLKCNSSPQAVLKVASSSRFFALRSTSSNGFHALTAMLWIVCVPTLFQSDFPSGHGVLHGFNNIAIIDAKHIVSDQPGDGAWCDRPRLRLSGLALGRPSSVSIRNTSSRSTLSLLTDVENPKETAGDHHRSLRVTGKCASLVMDITFESAISRSSSMQA